MILHLFIRFRLFERFANFMNFKYFIRFVHFVESHLFMSFMNFYLFVMFNLFHFLCIFKFHYFGNINHVYNYLVVLRVHLIIVRDYHRFKMIFLNGFNRIINIFGKN